MAAEVEKLLTVHKNTKVDAQMLEQADVDAVILAIGSSPITINLEGMELEYRLQQLHSFILNKTQQMF